MGVLTLAVVVAAAVPVINVVPQWWGWMPATMGTYLSVTVWGSPAIATGAAWVGGALRRSSMVELVASSPRGPQGVYREPVRLCSTIGGAVYTVVFVLMVGATWARSGSWPPGSTHLLLAWPLGVLSAICWAAVGVLLGRTLPAAIALPSALILGYVAFVVPVYYWSDSPLLALAVTDGRHWDYLQPSAGQLVTKLAFGCAAARLSLVAARSMYKGLVQAAWVTSLTAAVALFLGSVLTPIDHATDSICRGPRPVTCTDFAHASVLPSYQGSAARALAILPPALWPVRIDASTGAPAGSVAVGPVNGYTDPALVLDERQFVRRLGEGIFASCPGPAVPDSQAGLVAWWYLEHHLDMGGKPGFTGAPWVNVPRLMPQVERGRRLAAESAAEQRRWLTEHEGDIKSCSLSEDAWP